MPGVKGISQRAVLLGAIADGESRIDGFGRAADTETAISVVRQLGAEVDEDGSETVRVRGVGLRGLRAPDEPLDFGNAGTVMRLAAGILAGQEGRFELVGDESLSSRPQERIAEPLRQMGARVETTDGHAPVVIEGGGADADPLRAAGRERAGEVGGAARRAARGRRRDSRRRAAPDARPHRAPPPRARRVGPAARRTRSPSRRSTACRRSTIQIAGDFSSAAPFVVAATLLSGSELLVQGVNVNPLRTGFLDVLERMGANIAVFNRRPDGGEPVADLEVRSAPLTATQVDAEEVPRLIDELPARRARGRAGPRRDRRPRRRRAPRQGNGPDRNRDNFAESPWRAHRGER